MQVFHVFFVISFNKLLDKHSSYRWFKTPWSSWDIHCNDVLMSAMASQLTSLAIVYSRHRSKKTPKLRVTGLCAGNSSVTGELTTQRAINAENISFWCRHHALQCLHNAIPGGALVQSLSNTSTLLLPPHGRHGVSNPQQRDCLFNSVFRLTLKELTKATNIWPLIYDQLEGTSRRHHVVACVKAW